MDKKRQEKIEKFKFFKSVSLILGIGWGAVGIALALTGWSAEMFILSFVGGGISLGGAILMQKGLRKEELEAAKEISDYCNKEDKKHVYKKEMNKQNTRILDKEQELRSSKGDYVAEYLANKKEHSKENDESNEQANVINKEQDNDADKGMR